MLVTSRARKGYRGGLGSTGRRRLGIVSTPVGTSLVFSSSPIARTVAPIRNVLIPATVATPVTIRPTWGSNPPRNVISPVVNPSWPQFGPTSPSGWQTGQNGSGYGSWNAQGNPYGSTPQNPNNSQALAAAQALLATNPSLLTQSQFTMLQQAGLVSNTLPYSSVSNITPTTPLTSATTATTSAVNDPNCVAAGCTGGPYPNCTCAASATSSIGDTLSETVGGLPLYLWIAGAGLAFLLLRKK